MNTNNTNNFQLESAVDLSDKAKLSLYKKSSNSGISIDILEEVYRRGYSTWSEEFGGTPDSFAFDRVNSFVSGGFAAELDEDLKKACWKGYEAVGMKMKNGKKVPNCVPVKEQLDVPTLSVDGIAKKFDKPVNVIKKALKKGTKIEKEHTTDVKKAAEIARDHLSERPDYYKKLEKVEKGPVTEDAEAHSRDKNKPSSRFIGSDELVDIYAKDTPGQIIKKVVQEARSPAWQRKEGKREEGGLNQKGVESYRREHPGSKLKTAVTTDPSKLKKGSKAANRRKSFCSRMQGMKDKLTSAKTARDPDSRINKSLRAWNCEETIIEAGLDVQATPTPTASSVGPSKLSRNARVELSRRGPAGGEGLRNVGANRYSASSPTSMTGKRLTTGSTSVTAKTLTPQRVSANQPAPKTAAAPTSAPKPTASFGSTSRPTSVRATTGGVEKSAGVKIASGMSDAGKAKVKPTAPVEIPAAAGKAAGVLGKLARAATGPAATAAMTVMEPTPAGEKKSEFQRQADVAKGISYKPQGRSIGQIEKDVATTKSYARPKVDAPTPPTRPEYFSRGEAFKAARSEVGGSGGKFSYGGKEFQTNIAGEKYKPATELKPTSVKSETESGGTRKRIKEAVREKLNELSPETLGSYVTKAEKQMTKIQAKDPMNTTYGDTATFLKRKAGVETAKEKM